MQTVKTLNWTQPVGCLPGVGSAINKCLEKLGVKTIKDLLFHFPHRYLDVSKVCLINDLRLNEAATIIGTVKKVEKRFFSKHKGLVEVIISDKSGYISAVFFNQLYMASAFSEGDWVALAGKVEHKYGRLQINNPLYDKLDNSNSVHTMGILPFHPATTGISAKQLRSLIIKAVKYIPSKEVIPDIAAGRSLMPFSEALKQIHFPKSQASLERARQRLIFQELFELSIAVLLKKKATGKFKAASLKTGKLLDQTRELLPFKLTSDQEKVLGEILGDLSLAAPMNRLLQGEVGSGKTIIAFLSCLVSIESGFQACLMAPTEILARQHYQKIQPLTEKLGIEAAILTSSLNKQTREKTLAGIASGQTKLVLGTHALIQAQVSFKSLALVVVDEQHRFGVEQRQILQQKGLHAHNLVMSATPIPRSLALTLYGDLDVSTIKELPSGRNFAEKVTTVVCRPPKRKQAYEKIRREVAEGSQAYIVCPLIDPSDKIEAKAVEEEIEKLEKIIFPDLKVASIHGKLKSEEKERIMAEFSAGTINILVATTLIEVGVDVANATVMLIENAERFGLAQLHQLRGRIGRGEKDGVCILFAELKTSESVKRMQAIRELKDGFSLAEADLTIRGEGQLFGFKQAGLPDLKIAGLIRDFDVLLQARKEAKRVLETDPELLSDVALKKVVEDKFRQLLEISGG